MGSASALDEVTMLIMPDVVSLNGDGAQMRDLQGKMIAHAELMGDRMAILDTPDGMLPQEVLEWRMNTAGYDSKMAALYWPWIEVMDPLTRRPIRIPPSGHVAGVWARVDDSRGVHKAPANEVIRGANGLAFTVTHAEQGELNRNGINCIRAFPAVASGSGERARSRAIQNGATSTFAGCSITSPSRSCSARSGVSLSPTTSDSGRAWRRT